jgi:hypothetical protein
MFIISVRERLSVLGHGAKKLFDKLLHLGIHIYIYVCKYTYEYMLIHI